MGEDILKRIEAAIERVTRGSVMSIPVNMHSDADIVLSDCATEITRLRAEVEAFRAFTRDIRGLATSPDECEPNVSMRIAKLLAKHGVMDANGNILGDLVAAVGGEG